MEYISLIKLDFMNASATLKTIENIGYIEFFNPPHNALPPDLLTTLCELVKTAGQNPQIQVIVLKSGGDRTFCAGASFNHMLAISNEEEGKTFFMCFANLINALRKCPKIIIGAIQGKAVGGAVGLAAATDICFASEFALIKLSELSIGIGPFVIEPAIKRKIGTAAMTQLTLNSRTFFSAEWAQEKGLYANVFESNELLAIEVDRLAKELQSYNSEALSTYKEICWQGTEHWDHLLEKRATISGQLVLNTKTKSYLEKYS